MDEDDGLAALKKRIAEDFPGWRLLISDRGRWWAMHGPAPGEDVDAGPGAVDCDSFADLYARLVEIGARDPKPQVIVPVPHGYTLSGPNGP